MGPYASFTYITVEFMVFLSLSGHTLLLYLEGVHGKVVAPQVHNRLILLLIDSKSGSSANTCANSCRAQ